MREERDTYAAQLISLAIFFFAFHYIPSTKEGHLNILMVASVVTPFLALSLAKGSLLRAVVQSCILQLIYTLYGIYYWKRQDFLTDGFFSFENRLSVGFLFLLFIGSLFIAILARKHRE